MGLDTVEIVLRTEEIFGITLPDDECEQIRTVGDLYRLVLSKLDLPYIPSEQIHGEGKATSRLRLPIRKLFHKIIEFPITPDPAIKPWTTPEVWLTLKAIIQDQLQIDPTEIREPATFHNDLGCD